MGGVGLWDHAPTDAGETVSIAYRLCRAHWGHGYASEAILAGLRTRRRRRHGRNVGRRPGRRHRHPGRATRQRLRRPVPLPWGWRCR
ncbi:GNAT family N-acetyltransferase [Streptosporangium soli]